MGVYANGPALRQETYSARSMRNRISNMRQAVDLVDLSPVSAPFVEVNWVEGRVGAIRKEAGILMRTEDASDNHCKRSVKYTKPLPEGGADLLKGRRTDGWSFAHRRGRYESDGAIRIVG